jgi:ferrous iron transport protein A
MELPRGDILLLMQLASNKTTSPIWGGTRSLMALGKGKHGVLHSLELPEDVAYRLMLLGFVPGADVEFCGSAPGGDPRVFRVDNTEIALRKETAAQIIIVDDPAN